ncbi:MAG: SpoIVB peptidase [Firmicutes bacterium]|jgi:stage IV sporulation protein B|nr:SpoIVB peptidase [Bacillota bacterium]
MRRVFLAVAVVVFLVVTFLAFGAPLWVSWAGIPSEVRVFPGTELSLRIQLPFRLFDETGSDVTGDSGEFFFQTDKVGTTKYQVSLFGIFPISEMVVDVVPLVRVFPGGQSIGVLVSAHGLRVREIIAVQGLDGRDHFPARDAGILPGDILISIEGQDIHRPEQVSHLVNAAVGRKQELTVVVRRNQRVLTRQIRPVKARRTDVFGNTSEVYLLGIILEDPAAGVGTLTFYDPQTRRYGALGHAITDVSGRELVIDSGSIVEASIDSIRLGLRGSPGEKLGFFHGEQDLLGSIEYNSDFGIFGTLASLPAHPYFSEPIPVAFSHQVRVGPAEIYTVISGNRVERFAVEVIKVVNQNRPSDKGMVIQVTDKRLLQETGGIVQGMSGSPIVQDGMLIGAVTHVFVNDPTRGYGAFAEWMIYEAGLASDLPANSTAAGRFFRAVSEQLVRPLSKISIAQQRNRWDV